MENKKQLHKINLKPTLTLDIDFEIRADSEDEARRIGMAHIVKTIAFGFGLDPSEDNIKITFE